MASVSGIALPPGRRNSVQRASAPSMRVDRPEHSAAGAVAVDQGVVGEVEAADRREDLDELSIIGARVVICDLVDERHDAIRVQLAVRVLAVGQAVAVVVELVGALVLDTGRGFVAVAVVAVGGAVQVVVRVVVAVELGLVARGDAEALGVVAIEVAVEVVVQGIVADLHRDKVDVDLVRGRARRG
jgi:hypothetical protein